MTLTTYIMQNDRKLTNLDNQQIQRYTYDEENNAQRVIIVNQGQHAIYPQSQFSDIPQSGSLRSAGNLLQQPLVIKETVIEKIDVPVYITDFKEIIKTITLTEYKEIHVPFPVKEIVIEKIEVPVIIKEAGEIQIIEKPVIQEKLVYIEKANMKMFYIGLSLGILIMIIAHFLK